MPAALGRRIGAYAWRRRGASQAPSVATTLEVVSGTPQTIKAGATTASLVVRVLDQYAAAMAGVTVSWSKASNPLTLSATSSTTASNGQASITATSTGATGTGAWVTATVAGLTPVTFTTTVTAGDPAAVAAYSGDPQEATVSTAFAAALVVSVADAYANPCSGVTVSFAVPGSGATATLSAATATTAANGRASVTATAGIVGGTYNVTASVGALSDTFALTNFVIPSTAAQLALQGWAAPSSNAVLLMCDEASGNLVDELASVAFGPQGTPTPSYEQTFAVPTGKKCVTTAAAAGNSRFQCTNASKLDLGTSDATISMLIEPGTWADPGAALQALFGKYNTGYTVGWDVVLTSQIKLRLNGTAHTFSTNLYDAGHVDLPHLLTLAIDRDGNVSLYLDDAVTATVACSVATAITGERYATLMALDDFNSTFGGKLAWVYINVGTADGRTGHDALVAALGL